MAPLMAAPLCHAQEKPNVLLIMVDDMGYSDIGCYGGEILTPNIDALANKGVRFTQFYNTSRSCPARASMMTGLFQHQTGIGQMSEDPLSNPSDPSPNDWGTPGYKGYLNRNCVTIAEVLKESGYHTYMAGKWHLGMHGQEKWPLQRGFEHFYGILAGACSYLRPDGGRGLTRDNTKLSAPEAPYYTTDAFTDNAIRFIDEQQDDKPFFMYLAFNAPHWPLQAKEEDIAKFTELYREKGWDEIREARLQRMIELGIIGSDTEFAQWENRHWNELTETEKDNVAYRMAVYAAQVHCVDYNVGKMLDFLEDKGKLDNTLVIFLSDNGACAEPYAELGGGKMSEINDPSKSGSISYGKAWAQVSNTPFRKYKCRSYEGGISTPLIMVWKNGPMKMKNEWCTVPGYLPDIMPTIIEATGATYPETYHGGNKIHPLVGSSLFPAIEHKTTSLHEYMYWEHQGNRAIRHGNWKAIRDEQGQTWELYDVVNDRTERHNLASQNPELLNELVEKWDQWANENYVLPKRVEVTKLQNTTTRQNWGAHISNAVAVDVNNNGMRDLVFAGVGSKITNNAGNQLWERRRMSHVITFEPRRKRWNIVGDKAGDLAYFNEGIGFNVADRPSLSACDINQDGIMDIVAFESAGHKFDSEPYLDNISREGIFLGNGDGTFVQFEPQFVDTDGNAIEFDMRTVLSGDVADFNNDGLVDIVCVGYLTNQSNKPVTFLETNVVLINRGGGVFEVSHFLTGDYIANYGQESKKYDFECGHVVVYDFNNDGYADFFVISNSVDRQALGTLEGNDIHYTELFLNDPEHPGQFRRQFVNSRGIPAVSEGSMTVGDYNNDGKPDIFLSGWTGTARGKYVCEVYTPTIDADGSVTYTAVNECGLSHARGQSSTNRQYGSMDWDGDGNIDIFNMGWSPQLQTQVCFIGTGKGNGTFTEQTRLGGGSEGCLTFLDWNGDGSNDYVNISQTADKTFFDGVSEITDMFSVTTNPNKISAVPDMPATVAATCDNGKVTVAWTPAATAIGNETYEYYVTDPQGKIVAGGCSFIGGDKDGVRKVNQPGNAYNTRSITLSLPNGDYTIGVQTVNAALVGSKFNTTEITVTDSDTARPEAMVKPEVPEVGETYSNPVINANMPDPTVMRDTDGSFYLYGSDDTNNIPVYKSSDLINWTLKGTAFTDATRPSLVQNGGELTSPDINKIGDKYVLYFSESTSEGDECCIACAVADTPEGPFLNATKLFSSDEIGVQNSVAPFYIEDEGHKYLIWGSFKGIYAIELSDDGLSVKDGAQKKQIAGTKIESASIIKHDGYYYLIGSAGTSDDGANSTCCVLMARSTDIMGPYVNKLDRKALNNSFSNLLYCSPKVIGPGHNSEFLTDDAGQHWMLYHGWDANHIAGKRKVYLDKVSWDKEGWPMIENVRPSITAPVPVINKPDGIVINTSDMHDFGMSVYPKKTHDKVTISQSDSERFSWQIVNINGEKIKAGKADGSVTADLSDSPCGIYIVTARNKKGSVSEKIIRY